MEVCIYTHIKKKQKKLHNRSYCIGLLQQYNSQPSALKFVFSIQLFFFIVNLFIYSLLVKWKVRFPAHQELRRNVRYARIVLIPTDDIQVFTVSRTVTTVGSIVIIGDMVGVIPAGSYIIGGESLYCEVQCQV